MAGGSRRTTADRLRWAVRWGSRIEGLQLRYLGTSGIALARRRSVLLLETTGRRTGRRRRAGVSYVERGGAYLIGGGAGGMTRVDWVANLRANPSAAVWIRRRRIPVTARELVDAEYGEAKVIALRRWPDSARYEEVSGRPIPYFELRPTR